MSELTKLRITAAVVRTDMTLLFTMNDRIAHIYQGECVQKIENTCKKCFRRWASCSNIGINTPCSNTRYKKPPFCVFQGPLTRKACTLRNVVRMAEQNSKTVISMDRRVFAER